MNRLLQRLGIAAALVTASSVTAQQSWTPPSRSMPQMPTVSALRTDWQTSVGSWGRGVSEVSGVQPGQLQVTGEGSSGSAPAKFVRFTAGYLPAGTWTDRNGDGTADLVELFAGGARVIQVVDADYDGQANVLRVYTRSGELVREQRL